MPAAAALAPIDWIILGVYVIGMLLVGAFYSRYVHSAGDLFLAGRALPFWAIGVSIVASDIGAIDLVFGSSGAYEKGISQANFDWIGSVPALFLAAFIFVPYYWRSGVFSIPEFLGRRYGTPVQIIEATIWIGFMVANIAMMLWASAEILHTVLDWPARASIWATAFIIGGYTVAGGLAAIVMTDVMQVVVMFIGAGALVVLSVWEAGGWSQVVAKAHEAGAGEHYFKLIVPHDSATSYPWTGVLVGLGIVLSTAYFVGNQAVLQRALGAKSEWDAKAGLIVAGLLKLAVPVLMFVPGLAARALETHEAPAPAVAVKAAPEGSLEAMIEGRMANQAVPNLVKRLMPAGLRGLMFAAFFAAIMSSVDSYLNSCATLFISDVYGKFHVAILGEPVGDRLGLWMGRGLTLLLLLVGCWGAPIVAQYGTLYEALQTILSLFQGPTLAILLLGILWRRANMWGALVGLLVGVMSSYALTVAGDEIFPPGGPFLFVAFYSFLISLAVTFAVSLLTPPLPWEQIRGLVYGSVLHDAEIQAALQDRVERLEEP